MQMIRQSIALNTEYLEVLQNKVIFKLNKSLDIQYFSVLQIINNSLFSPLWQKTLNITFSLQPMFFSTFCRNLLCWTWSKKLQLWNNKPAGLLFVVTLHPQRLNTRFNWHSSQCFDTVLTMHIWQIWPHLGSWIIHSCFERQMPSTAASFRPATKWFQQPHCDWMLVCVSKWLDFRFWNLSDRSELPSILNAHG